MHWDSSSGDNQNRLLKQPLICEHEMAMGTSWLTRGHVEGKPMFEGFWMRKAKAGGLTHGLWPGEVIRPGTAWFLMGAGCSAAVAWCGSSPLSFLL